MTPATYFLSYKEYLAMSYLLVQNNKRKWRVDASVFAKTYDQMSWFRKALNLNCFYSYIQFFLIGLPCCLIACTLMAIKNQLIVCHFVTGYFPRLSSLRCPSFWTLLAVRTMNCCFFYSCFLAIIIRTVANCKKIWRFLIVCQTWRPKS